MVLEDSVVLLEISQLSETAVRKTRVQERRSDRLEHWKAEGDP